MTADDPPPAPPLERDCPTCGSDAGSRCRTLTTGRSTDTHEARRHR